MKQEWFTYAITIAALTFVGFTSFNNTAAASYSALEVEVFLAGSLPLFRK